MPNTLNPALFLRAPQKPDSAVRKGLQVELRYHSDYCDTGRPARGIVQEVAGGAIVVRVDELGSKFPGGSMEDREPQTVELPLDRVWAVNV